jgi:hypothetical protein
VTDRPMDASGVPDDLRLALQALRAVAPPRSVDEGHYANRALGYLERLERHFRARHDCAPPDVRRAAFEAVVVATMGARPDRYLDWSLALLAVLADVPERAT